MAYPYGTQGAPAVGGGAPGLPQRSPTVGADPLGPALQVVVVRPGSIYENTPFVTPDWATYCRVTAVGKGGQAMGGLYGLAISASGAHGGAGAGLAATAIEPTPPGVPIAISFTSAATLVAFLNYQLSGGNGGDATSSGGGSGGVGSGGAINFNGGNGGTAPSSSDSGAGGGAAGRGGNGVSASGNLSANSGPGDTYVTGGGAGGASTSNAGTVRVGAVSRVDASSVGAILLGKSTTSLNASSLVAPNSNGGDAGGGAGGVAGGPTSNLPGIPVVLIELW
jgi:hypothetical protein